MSDQPAKTKSTGHVLIFIVIGLVVLCVVSNLFSGGGGSESSSRSQGITMYVCGYDRCRESGEYGDLIYSSGINVWQNPDPNRGRVVRTVSNGDGVTVVDQERASSGPGGLWYELSGGGWINDFWLTKQQCSPGNLELNSFENCIEGKY